MSQLPNSKPSLSAWLENSDLAKYEKALNEKCGMKTFDDLLLLLSEAQMREVGKEANMTAIDRYRFMKGVVSAKQQYQAYDDKKIEEYFKSFDTDGDGVVSKTELKDGLAKMGIKASDSLVERILKNIDEDGNGTLDFDEFKQLFQTKSSHVKYTEEEIKEFFKSFDTDGDGMVSAKELEEGLKKIGRTNVTKEQVNNLLKNVDEDGNGELDYDEFKKLMEMQLTYTQEEIKELFKSFDIDGDGMVTATELKDGLIKLGRKNITDEVVNKMLKNVDEDGNGELDYDEFVKLFS